jgi:hypothetical protein
MTFMVLTLTLWFDIVTCNWYVKCDNRVYVLHNILIQGGTNPGPQVAMANKLCTVAPNICESPIRNLLPVTILTLRILRHRLGVFFKCVHPFERVEEFKYLGTTLTKKKKLFR